MALNSFEEPPRYEGEIGLLVGALYFLVIGAIVGFAARRIRFKYPERTARLGLDAESGIWGSKPIGLLMFLLGREATSLGEPEISRLGWIARFAVGIMIVAVVAFAVADF